MQSRPPWMNWTLALALVLALFFTVRAVQAEEVTCQSSLGAVTVDNLRVPQSATCILTGTRVEGTITVEANATLQASNVTVISNIQAENAAQVNVASGSVGGSIQIFQSGSATITTVQITGDLYFDENSRALLADQNIIGGNLQAFQNTGGVTFTVNTIDGNLQCKENIPTPTGGGNIVQGNKEDQCADLLLDSDDDDHSDDDDFYGFIESRPAGTAGTWIIGGRSFTATSSTELEQEYGIFAMGAFVEVEYTLVDGIRVAEEIETHVAPGRGRNRASGPLEQRPDDDLGTWRIGGNTYVSDPAIEVDLNNNDDDLLRLTATGTQVTVNYYVTPNGTRRATSVRPVATNRIYLPLVER